MFRKQIWAILGKVVGVRGLNSGCGDSRYLEGKCVPGRGNSACWCTEAGRNVGHLGTANS